MSYVNKLLEAKKLAEASDIPHSDLSFTEPSPRAVDLKRCIMTAKKAVEAMTPPASHDPRHNCVPVCVAISDAWQSAGYPHEVVFGNVIKNGKPLLSNVSAQALIDTYHSKDGKNRPNAFCWLALSDGSIVDFTLQVKPSNKLDSAKIAESFLYLPPTEKDKRYQFEPMLIGRAILDRLNAIRR